MTRSRMFHSDPTDVITRFLASRPSLEEIEGAIYGDDVDPRCTPEQRQALNLARMEAVARGK